LACPVLCSKRFRFPRRANHLYKLAPSCPTEGRAHVTNAGRDAVDADGAFDERRVMRTAKSCGPDAPTLASSRRRQPTTVANKPGHRGEHEVTVKTIARGMPGGSGVTVVTMLVCSFYFAREAAGASSARHSLRPLISQGQEFTAKLARNARRDCRAVSGNGCLKIESVAGDERDAHRFTPRGRLTPPAGGRGRRGTAAPGCARPRCRRLRERRRWRWRHWPWRR
jgi:hypothetical protein